MPSYISAGSVAPLRLFVRPPLVQVLPNCLKSAYTPAWVVFHDHGLPQQNTRANGYKCE
jgi:hypothetical protein